MLRGNVASFMPENIYVPWWKTLNRYHWFVFVVATAAWMLDCLDQQLFVLARDNAVKSLLPATTSKDDLRWYGAVSYTHLTLPTIYSV